MKLQSRNREVREKFGKLPIWVVAEGIGVSENTLLRWLRQDLTADRKDMILAVVSELNSDLGVDAHEKRL